MSKGKNKFLVLIMLLIFVGQVMASASLSCNMPTEMMMQTHSMPNHDMSTMSHDMPTMNHDMSEVGANMADCCSDDNNCNMSTCISLGLPNESQLAVNHFSSELIYLNFTWPPSQTTTSLYRPPILA